MTTSSSLFFRIKDTTALEKHRIIELFVRSWIDMNCNNEVNYIVAEHIDGQPYNDVFRVDFDRIEDAIILKLKGIPDEFAMYVELMHQ